MNRREFLFGVAAVAVVAAVPGISIAQVEVVDEFAKYRESLRLMDLALELKGKFPLEPYEFPGHRGMAAKQDTPQMNIFHSRTDTLLAYMHANFPVPAKTTEEKEMVVKILYWSSSENLKSYEEALRSLPPEFAEIIFPVAVVRFILRDQNMPLNHRRLKEFKPFCDRYMDHILNH
jgi:hypothetical protein